MPPLARFKKHSAPPCVPPDWTSPARSPQTASFTDSKQGETEHAIHGLCYTLARPPLALSAVGNAARKKTGTAAKATCRKRNGKLCAASGERLRPPASAQRLGSKKRREPWPPGFYAAPSLPMPHTPTLRQRP